MVGEHDEVDFLLETFAAYPFTESSDHLVYPSDLLSYKRAVRSVDMSGVVRLIEVEHDKARPVLFRHGKECQR